MGACGRSTEYFMRLFKATNGVSLYQYVLNVRVERARMLLGDETRALPDAHSTPLRFRARRSRKPGLYMQAGLTWTSIPFAKNGFPASELAAS
jgi:AraC-like DNA-binding protein